MNIVIIKYNGGNTQSVAFAIERLGITPVISTEADVIKAADKVIFPGVGEASSAMRFLKNHNLDSLISQLKQPVLGICLGMQLLCRHTEEGNTSGLGIFNVEVKRFKAKKVPHMGWNTVKNNNSRLLKSNAGNSYMYFVHSYYAECCELTTGITDYDIQFSSVLEKDNFYGVQFHAEKSAEAGAMIIQNFLEL